MTSVDSGVETSNDSSDSCVTHESKALEISPIKVSSRVTNGNVIAPKCCPSSCNIPSYHNTPSSSSSNREMSPSEEKGLGGFQPKSRRNFDLTELEPPAGISYCNLQAACGLGKGYEIIGKEFVKNFSPEYDSSEKWRARSKFSRRFQRYKSPWLYFKEPLDERRLRYAASTNNVEQVETLLNSGVYPNCSDDQFRSPLHLSACRGYTDVVRLLLEKGANPNQRDSLGNTPLHLAACTNHVEVVTLLLKAGTDVHSSDSFGRNPLQLAQSKLKLLQRGANNEDSWKIKNEVQKVIEMMLTFLHKKGQDSEAELLNAFQTRLTLSQTKEEVETDVRDLLASLSNLNINKNET